MPDNTQQSLLDMARELPVERNYLDLVREVGRDQRQQTAPGGMEAQAAGETAGSMLSSGLTPFGFQRGAEALSVVMAKLFGDEGTGQLAEQIYRADDKALQTGGGIRDTVGRSLAGMTAATVRGAATTLEAVVPDAVDPLAKVEGFTRGMATTSAVVSDTYTDKITAAVTNGVANIALGVAAPMAAPALFFLQGAGGAANEYDQAYIDGMLTSKDGLYKPGDKYIAALKGGVIEGATEWLGAKTAKSIGASVWGKGAIKSIEKMNPAMKFAVGTGLAYASEAAEEGGASIAYSLTKNWQGQERPEFWDGAKEAFADAFYGGFGGAGAHPLIAVGEAAQAKRMRNRISAEIARSNNAFSDPDFWEAMPKATVDAMRAMSPQERELELSSARDAYHQSNADRQAGAAALNSAATALDNAQKELSRANKRGKQDAIDAATKNVEAAQAGFDSAFSNQSILGAELLSARTRLMTIAAFNARNTPTVTRNTTDVLAAEKLSIADPSSDTDNKVKSEMESLGYDVQFFDPTDPNDTRPAFYNPATPNTVYLRSGMKESEFAAAMGYAYHEVVHVIQATDGDLYKALRQSFDEQSTVEAGVQYFNDKLRTDDRLAQAAAQTIAAEVGGQETRPMMQGQMVEERAGRALLRAEGEAQITQSAMEEFFKTGKAPGLLGQVIIRLGLRGKQAATALRVRSMLMKGAQERIARKAAPAKTGDQVALTEFGRQIEEAKGVVSAVGMAETPPAPTAPSTTAAAPAAAAAAPSAAPVPPSASAAALTASGMTPADAAAARTPDFRAMINLAVNNLRKADKKFAQGKKLYEIVEQMERDPAVLSDEDRQIGRQMQQEMYAEFGPKYASLWARQSKPQAAQPSSGRTLVSKAIEVLGLTEPEIKSTVIDLMTGNPGRNAFQKSEIGRLPAVVKFLHDRRLQSGLKVLDINSEEDRETISRLLAAEAIGAINSAGSALEWYDSTIRNTLAQAALKYPELESDPRARLAFLLTMAISSQGLNVESNLNFTMRQYGEYRNTVDATTGIGQFREIGEGKHSGAQANNFRIANSMIKSIGPDRMIQFLRTSFTAKELTDAGLEIGGELKSEQVLGSAIFGPKIGFGFYSNLDGNFDPVTMDMWFMRTIGRLSGTLPAFERGKFDKQVARLRAGLTQRGSNGIFPSALDPAMVERAKDDSLGDAPVIELARAVAKLHERDFVENRAQYDNKTRVQSQMVLASKSIVQSLDKPRDSPKSGGERRALRDVVRRAVKKVSDIYGKDVANAAFQALIWYPEQELYRALGVRLKVTSQDYSGAIRKLLKTEGFNDGQLDGAIAAAQSRSTAARQVAGSAVAGTSGVAGAVAVPSRTLTEQQRQQFLAETPVSIAKSWVAPEPAGTLNPVQSQFFKQFAAIGFVRDQQRGSYSQDWRYGRSGDGDGKKPRILKVARKFEDAGKKTARKIALPFIATIEAGDALATLFKRQELLTPKFHELKSTKQTATWFHEQIMAFKASNKNGAAVEGKSVEELLAARMFVSRNGQSGFAIKPNGDIVSVFSEKGGGRAILEAAIASGGRRLDCFDTVLPVIYGAHGFKAVARMAWNDQYKPDDWDYANFQKYNNGRPDVVFMVHDPMSMAQYEPNDGQMMTEYDNGMAAQDAELAKIKPSLDARFRESSSKEIVDAVAASGGIWSNVVQALHDIIASSQPANAADGVGILVFPKVRANYSPYGYGGKGLIELQEDQLPPSMSGSSDPSSQYVLPHELMHAATSRKIRDYQDAFIKFKAEQAGVPVHGIIGTKIADRYTLAGKHGADYIDVLERYSTDADVDPAFKELIDCFLEAAKSAPKQYELMTKGRGTYKGVKFSNSFGPVVVRDTGLSPTMQLIRSQMKSDGSKSNIDAIARNFDIVATISGVEYILHQTNDEGVANSIAGKLNSGEPINEMFLNRIVVSDASGNNATFKSTMTKGTEIPGLSLAYEYSGGGLVNVRNMGDALVSAGGLYGFGNLDEFIAESVNEPAFRNVLKALPSKGRGVSVFKRFVNAMRVFLGLPEVMQTMLDDLFRLTEEIGMEDLVGGIGKPARRVAVPGEVAPRKPEPIMQNGFRLGGSLQSASAYPRFDISRATRTNDGISLQFKSDGVSLSRKTNYGVPNVGTQVVFTLQPSVDSFFNIYKDKSDGLWKIDRVSIDGVGTGGQYNKANELKDKHGIPVEKGMVVGKLKSEAQKNAARLIEDGVRVLSAYNKSIVGAQMNAAASMKYDVVLRDLTQTSAPQSLAARSPAKRFMDEVARGERKWALTDKDGKPVMVYHGTIRQSPVDPFVTKVGVRGEPMTRAGQKGMSFTDEPTFAESFGDQVYPAWISAKNPVTLEIGGHPYDRIPVWVAERLMMDYIDTYGIATHKIDAEFFDPDTIAEGIENGWLKSETDEVPYTTTDYLAGYLLAEGYDAVVLKNVEDEGSQNRGAWRKTLHTEIVVGSKDPIINALTNLRTTDKEYRVLAARPSVSPEAKADVAAVAIFDVAKKRLGTLLNSLPKDKTKWSAADVAAVKAARKEVMAAVRGLKRKPKGADVGSMAYGMGRREGQVGGMIKGRKEGMREERDRQRAEAIAKRKELRTSFVARVEKLRAQIEAAAEKNDALRQRMEMMRKMERLNKDAAAERAGKRVIKAWFAGQQKGSTAGYNEAKREMKEIRKAAAEVIATLPRSMRGKYIDAVARMKTAAGIDQIARRVVRDLAIAEAAETVGDINRLIKRVKKVGLRAETRTNLLTDLSAARAMLASGKKRLLPFTNTADLANRTAAARSLQEGVLHEFDMERQEYRDARDERAMEAAADAVALGKTLAALPKIERGKLSSVAPKRGIVADILASNSNADMYTLMQAIEGGQNGIFGKIWSGISASKGRMTLARKAIDEKIDQALKDAGYNGYDGYATTAAGLYGESAAESSTVTIGGKPMTITTDQLLNIAAMDQQTVDLLTDAADPAGEKGAPIVFSTDRNAKPMYLTKQEFDAIRAGLSTGQRNLIDTMKSILDTDIRPAAFDIHFQIHGKQPSIVPGYFPRKRLGDEIAEQGIDPNMQPGAVVNTMLSNAGFLQERVAAKSTMVIGGMMRTMDDHIEESLRLIHLTLPLRHAMTVLKSAAVRTGIEETMGDGGNDSIRKLVLNGVGLSGKPQGGFIEGINANVSGALITINPKTWLRQIGGVFRLASEMPAGAWAAGVGRMMIMSPSERAKMAQSIESMNGYFYDRHRRSQVGIFANVLGNPNNSKDRWTAALQSSARSFRAIGEDVAAGRFTQAARDVRDGLLPISRVMKSADGVLRMIDRQIMLAAFLGARADVMKTNPSMSAAEADVAAARLAEYAFRKTQNVSDPMDDTVFAARQKFSQGIGRLMFPFSSDPLKAYNQMRRAIASRDPALIARTSAGITGNIATAAAVNPLWMTAGLAIANAIGGSGDDEDDEMIRQMEMEKQLRYLGPTIASDASAVAFGYLGMAAGAMIDGAMGSPERADDVLEPLVVRFLGDTTQYVAKGQMSMGAKAALQMAGVPIVAPFSSVESVYKAANPSDSKLLEYYRKLDRAGQLNLKQRQRMNVLAASERMRLAREKRDKVLNP